MATDPFARLAGRGADFGMRQEHARGPAGVVPIAVRTAGAMRAGRMRGGPRAGRQGDADRGSPGGKKGHLFAKSLIQLVF